MNALRSLTPFTHKLITTLKMSTSAQGASSTAGAAGPIERLIQQRIVAEFEPVELHIENESHKHRHHAPMRGSKSSETHFRIRIVSPKFAGQRLIQRQRAVYALFKDEMAMENGIHAMALVTKTPEEL